MSLEINFKITYRTFNGHFYIGEMTLFHLLDFVRQTALPLTS